MTSCACLGLVIFPRISVGSGFMPGDSPALSQSLWLLLRCRGAVFAGAQYIRCNGPFLVSGITPMAILSLVLPWLR